MEEYEISDLSYHIDLAARDMSKKVALKGFFLMSPNVKFKKCSKIKVALGYETAIAKDGGRLARRSPTHSRSIFARANGIDSIL